MLVMTVTFDTSADCVFLYSLFPASFLYTMLSLEDKKFFVIHNQIMKNSSSTGRMHIVSAIIVIGLFTTLTYEQAEQLGQGKFMTFSKERKA